MDYAEILLDLPIETRDIINRTVQIFFVINKKNFTFVNSKNEKFLLTSEDKKCIALYLAGISFGNELSEILLKSNFSKNDIFSLFNLDIDDDCLYENCLSYTKVLDVFNKDLKEFIYRLRCASEFGVDKVENKEFHSEILYINLFSEVITYSTIFPDIVEIGNIDNIEFVNELKVIFSNKLKNNQIMPLELNIDDIRNNPCIINSIGYNNFLNNSINSLGVDMTASSYISDPAVGREDEINKLIRILMTPEKSVMLTGNVGVGKTSIVEGLAYRIQNGNVPNVFKNKKIIKINVSSLLSGCIYFGSFEERIENLITMLMFNSDNIVFIDEIHNVKVVGNISNNVMDLSDLLKPYLDRGLIKIIGATTTENYNSYILNDNTFRKCFETLKVRELSTQQLFNVIHETIVKLENIMGVDFDFDYQYINYIVNSLVEISLLRRVNANTSSNIDFALDILKKIFVYAQFENDDKVNVNHIISAISEIELVSSSLINKYKVKIKCYNGYDTVSNNVVEIENYVKKLKI